MIIPSPANPANSANMPSPITNTPADLKNRGAYFELAKEKEVKDRSPKTGKVQLANFHAMRMYKQACDPRLIKSEYIRRLGI